jgi:hypothetical protein
MFGTLTAFDALLRESSSNSAVAAAVTVLSTNPPPDRLDPALRGVAPHLTGAGRAAPVGGSEGGSARLRPCQNRR